MLFSDICKFSVKIVLFRKNSIIYLHICSKSCTFALDTMSRRYIYSDYYRDRFSEAELCRDFPGDELFIDGLNAMQMHMWNNGVNIDIPVLRVMNTAHLLAAYMFATTCSGDQLEYDALANDNLGRDRQLFKVAIIVLAAMLKRTEGYRAQNCRNIILGNRDPDFDEGVTLYDRFLRSAEERFAEEDFLIDTHRQIQRLIAQNEQLAVENRELKIQYRLMQNQQNNQQNNQYNITYNAPVYQGCTFNDSHDTHYVAPSSAVSPETSASGDQDLSAENIDSIIFTKKAKKEGKEATIIAALQKSVQGRNDKTRAFVQELQEWQEEGYVDAHYNAKVMYDELEKMIPLTFGYETFKKYYNNTI